MANETGERPKPPVTDQPPTNEPELNVDERQRRLEDENVAQPLEALIREIREQNQPQKTAKPESPQDVLRRLRAARRASEPLIVRNPRNKPRP